MIAWLSINSHVLISTLKKLGKAPFSSFFSICVIGLALSLPTGTYVLLENIESLTKSFGSPPQISLFMARNANPAEVSEIEKRLKQDPLVDRFRFVSKEEALKRFQQDAEFSDVAASLSKNPLPDAFVVLARKSEDLEAMSGRMKAWPKIEHVQLDADWVRKLDSFLKVGRIAAIILAVVLGLALVFITFNTIRLQILTQKDEI
ncbi:MAG TPA: permease-like cell division protein FtsX, partial [Burkholderiales bacterium]|nr:permease-like cell division protein FtsX [Burkholderiales bacterium]